jgi:ADP-ribose pyrophosphatase
MNLFTPAREHFRNPQDPKDSTGRRWRQPADLPILRCVTVSYLEPSEWYSSLPTVYLAASVLLTDVHDRVLLVKPSYRPEWGMPGGVVEDGETPHECAVREIGEELALTIRADDLLVVDWSAPLGDRPRSLMVFLFDGGTVPDPSRIRLPPDELEDVTFLPWNDAAALLPGHIAPRIPAARRARQEGRTIYLPGQAG